MRNGVTVTKAEVMEEAALGKGCLGRAAPDEPVWIVRAHDEQFVDSVAGWIAGARARGVGANKIKSAQQVLEAGREWRRDHGTKVAD